MGFDFVYEFTAAELYRSSPRRHRYPWHLLMRDFLPELPERNTKAKFRLRYAVELSASAAGDISFSGAVFPRSIIVEVSAILPDSREITGTQIHISSSGSSMANYEMRWKNLTPRPHRKEIQTEGSAEIKSVEFINLMPVEFVMANEDDTRHHDALMIFYRTGELLRSIFGSLTYLGPLREEPARRYIYENEVVEIGVKGENAAYIYMAEGSKRVKNHFFYNYHSSKYEPKEDVSLHESVKLWLDIMGIHAFDAKRESEIIRLLLNSSTHDDLRVNIADVGFGVSQVFPIVLEGLRMHNGQTLLLEQPEIHLHPRLQMQLGDYLVSLALSGKNVILETHSDHIVNRLVRRLIEDSTYGLEDLLAIYFVRQTPNGSVVETVEISEKDGIVNWPEEFFDQAGIEQQLIMRAIVAKQKKENLP
jgi:hypothetical protein